MQPRDWEDVPYIDARLHLAFRPMVSARIAYPGRQTMCHLLIVTYSRNGRLSAAWIYAWIYAVLFLCLSVPLVNVMCCHARAILSMTSASDAATGQAPDLANNREKYVSSGIDEKTLPSEPHVLMAKWVEAACNSRDVSDPLSYK